MISKVYIEINQGESIYRKTLGYYAVTFACLHHHLCHRTVTFTMLDRQTDTFIYNNNILFLGNCIQGEVLFINYYNPLLPSPSNKSKIIKGKPSKQKYIYKLILFR